MNPTSEIPIPTPAPQPAPEPAAPDPIASSALPAVVPDANPPQEANAASPPKSGPIQMSSVMGVVEGLSDDEGMEFMACETVIDTGWRGVLDVGLGFACIRDKRLYRVEFETFEAYCQSKWQYGRRYVNRVIAGAELFRDLGTNCFATRMKNMNYVNHCLTWFSMSRSCFSQQVFYGSRRLAGGESYCQRSEASQTM